LKNESGDRRCAVDGHVASQRVGGGVSSIPNTKTEAEGHATSANAAPLSADSVPGNKKATNATSSDALSSNTLSTDAVPTYTASTDPTAAYSVPTNTVPTDPTAANSVSADALPANSVPADTTAANSVPTDALPADSVSADAVPADAVPTDPIPINKKASNATSPDALSTNPVSIHDNGRIDDRGSHGEASGDDVSSDGIPDDVHSLPAAREALPCVPSVPLECVPCPAEGPRRRGVLGAGR
jgi:hypothetical protein